MTIWGIDISSHQPDEDWQAIKDAGISFVAVKRTGGDGYVNPNGRAQVAGARSVGLTVIHYLYLGEPGYANRSGLAQAAFFIGEVGDDIQVGEGISVDWEENGYADLAEGLACLDELTSHYGFKPSIYTYPSYVTEHNFASVPRLGTFPLWYAAYRSDYPAAPAPWQKIMAWQYSDNGSVPGVGHVDLDRFEGTVEELRAYGKKPTVATLADEIAKGINVVSEPHPDGMMSPVTATFLNPDQPGMGIPYKLGMWCWNPQEQAHYYGEWEMGAYKPWVKLPKED